MHPRHIPIFTAQHVYHVGNLGQAKPVDATDSQEGNTISVSMVPHAWTYIARLNGEFLHTIEKTPLLTFLDLRSALEQPALVTHVAQWAAEQKLIERKTLWRAWRYDSEVEEWTFLTCATQDEALNENSEIIDLLGEDDAQAPAGHSMIESTEMWVSTKLLADRMQQLRFGDCDALDFAMLAWADACVAGLDGVWWEDNFDPYAYSAPKGGLFQRALSVCNIRVEPLKNIRMECEAPGLQAGQHVVG